MTLHFSEFNINVILPHLYIYFGCAVKVKIIRRKNKKEAWKNNEGRRKEKSLGAAFQKVPSLTAPSGRSKH
ncbi:MAG: hypothetical protein LBE57_05335 [Methanosarcinales archaeon]|jgi:hypothetical protein|nr:hypothetical protein [Methanosarcinales archaeon]